MKRLTYLIVILLAAANSFAQGHFVVSFIGAGHDHMTIYVVNATIGTTTLEAGDEIAVFDGSVCCGKATLSNSIVITNKSTFALVAASQKDNGSSNGFSVGNAITYKFWDSSQSKEFSGLTAEYLNPVTGQPITAPTFMPNETVFVKLSVAVPANQAPSSNAGQDQNVNEGGTVSLDGSASSDPDGNPLTYKWTAPAGITLSSTTNAKPIFTAPQVTVNTSFTITLVVNDGLADSPADHVVITVRNVDHAPYVNNPIKKISVDKGVPDQIIDLKTIFADDDFGDVLVYNVTSNTNDLVVDAKITGSNLTLNFSTVNIGLSEIVVSASSNGKEVNSKFTVEVNIPTSIDPIGDNSPEILIYPNPTKGEVKLSFSQLPMTGTSISIYNIAGKLTYKSIIYERDSYLNMTEFPDGMYIFKIYQKMYKLIKL